MLRVFYHISNLCVVAGNSKTRGITRIKKFLKKSRLELNLLRNADIAFPIICVSTPEACGSMSGWNKIKVSIVLTTK